MVMMLGQSKPKDPNLTASINVPLVKSHLRTARSFFYWDLIIAWYIAR
ncbi:hypothetical protein SAMN06296008_11468 [Polynucleobacter kasalickyi]|uniref:Uncharacterized protein n=1 Tax=Polynucleobacter kasalickyi TaxID=1938817 RepID=A0A1W2BP88_9BURK|nr:hypothetical protein SAMN06296008_11468 [Polynucleobacter kasalickyi]